ncbi:uncharacterized protein LOC106083724 [Stomoxys calcitrans]|uniref:uncharacterized protein LOC106083724 n=1 Tax=Stomoxys calcitrans TaxID=35570 RepID=UPI0027E30F96|nr:uncharacterized protein LOC106083724 [Stomoxys calcitrans]
METIYYGQQRNRCCVPPILYYDELSPQARSCCMLIRLLNIDVDLRFSPGGELCENRSQINPGGIDPILIDGKITLSDGHTIMMYLCDKYASECLPHLWPSDYFLRLELLNMMFYEAGVLNQLHRQIMSDILVDKYPNVDMRKYHRKVEECYNILDAYLEGHIFLVGNCLTIADFSTITTLGSLDMIFPIDSEHRPNLTRWYENLKNMDCYKCNLEGIERQYDLLETIGEFPFAPDIALLPSCSGRNTTIRHSKQLLNDVLFPTPEERQRMEKSIQAQRKSEEEAKQIGVDRETSRRRGLSKTAASNVKRNSIQKCILSPEIASYSQSKKSASLACGNSNDYDKDSKSKINKPRNQQRTNDVSHPTSTEWQAADRFIHAQIDDEETLKAREMSKEFSKRSNIARTLTNRISVQQAVNTKSKLVANKDLSPTGDECQKIPQCERNKETQQSKQFSKHLAYDHIKRVSKDDPNSERCNKGRENRVRALNNIPYNLKSEINNLCSQEVRNNIPFCQRDERETLAQPNSCRCSNKFNEVARNSKSALTNLFVNLNGENEDVYEKSNNQARQITSENSSMLRTPYPKRNICNCRNNGNHKSKDEVRQLNTNNWNNCIETKKFCYDQNDTTKTYPKHSSDQSKREKIKCIEFECVNDKKIYRCCARRFSNTDPCPNIQCTCCPISKESCLENSKEVENDENKLSSNPFSSSQDTNCMVEKELANECHGFGSKEQLGTIESFHSTVERAERKCFYDGYTEEVDDTCDNKRNSLAESDKGCSSYGENLPSIDECDYTLEDSSCLSEDDEKIHNADIQSCSESIDLSDDSIFCNNTNSNLISESLCSEIQSAEEDEDNFSCNYSEDSQLIEYENCSDDSECSNFQNISEEEQTLLDNIPEDIVGKTRKSCCVGVEATICHCAIVENAIIRCCCYTENKVVEDCTAPQDTKPISSSATRKYQCNNSVLNEEFKLHTPSAETTLDECRISQGEEIHSLPSSRSADDPLKISAARISDIGVEVVASSQHLSSDGEDISTNEEQEKPANSKSYRVPSLLSNTPQKGDQSKRITQLRTPTVLNESGNKYEDSINKENHSYLRSRKEDERKSSLLTNYDAQNSQLVNQNRHKESIAVTSLKPLDLLKERQDYQTQIDEYSLEVMPEETNLESKVASESANETQMYNERKVKSPSPSRAENLMEVESWANESAENSYKMLPGLVKEREELSDLKREEPQREDPAKFDKNLKPLKKFKATIAENKPKDPIVLKQPKKFSKLTPKNINGSKQKVNQPTLNTNTEGKRTSAQIGRRVSSKQTKEGKTECIVKTKNSGSTKSHSIITRNSTNLSGNEMTDQPRSGANMAKSDNKAAIRKAQQLVVDKGNMVMKSKRNQCSSNFIDKSNIFKKPLISKEGIHSVRREICAIETCTPRTINTIDECRIKDESIIRQPCRCHNFCHNHTYMSNFDCGTHRVHHRNYDGQCKNPCAQTDHNNVPSCSTNIKHGCIEAQDEGEIP